jgi:hypothetical protein
MERGSFDSRFDDAQWKLAEHPVWAYVRAGSTRGYPRVRGAYLKALLLPLLVYAAGIRPQPFGVRGWAT